MEKLIEEALFHHNCVIIPDFGGFITRESPCGFSNQNKFLKPESTSVFFNSALTQNEGTLLNFINEKLNSGYSEAQKMVKNFVENINEKLTNEGYFNLGNIGKFYLNNQNVKWFAVNPNLNLSIKSYGLVPVEVQKIDRIKTEIKEIKSWQADKVEIEKLPDLNKKWNWKPWVAAASIALVSHFVYLGVENKNTNHASVITPLIDSKNNQEVSKVEESKVIVPENIVNNTTIENPIVENEIVEPKVENSIIEPETSTNEIKENIQALEENKVEETIILARYRFKENAEFHLADIQKKGIEATIEIKDKYYLIKTNKQ